MRNACHENYLVKLARDKYKLCLKPSVQRDLINIIIKKSVPNYENHVNLKTKDFDLIARSICRSTILSDF